MKRLLVTAFIGAMTMLGGSPMPAAIVSPAGLSGCAAHLLGNTGGHSYCSAGGTTGVQRVKVYCDPVWSSNNVVVYGAWTVAGAWSTAYCNDNGEAVQAQYELR